MVYKKMSDEDRRRMVLAAFGPDANITRIAETYGITRKALYGHIYRATADPERQWRDADAEASFRRKVYEMTR